MYLCVLINGSVHILSITEDRLSNKSQVILILTTVFIIILTLFINMKQ